MSDPTDYPDADHSGADHSAGSYADVVARLRSVGAVFAEDEARLLLDAAAGRPDRLAAMVARRIRGEPLEVIVGWAEFGDLRVQVDAGVFVPRRRSLLLADVAAEAAVPGDVVVDLCCGSGAVGLAIASAVPGIDLHAADSDPTAVRCARRNLARVGGQVHRGDLFDALPAALRGRVALIVANAPYVPTDAIDQMPREARLFEPHTALDGGPDGVGVHRRIAASAVDWLRPGGRLLIETGARQVALTRAALASAGLSTTVFRDDDLSATVVAGASISG